MIYVDSPVYYPDTPLRYKVWSHMWSDTSVEELNAMADKIGLRREWFQCKVGSDATEAQRLFRAHYDIVPTKRALAIKYGAVPKEIRDWYAEQLAKEHKQIKAYYGDN